VAHGIGDELADHQECVVRSARPPCQDASQLVASQARRLGVPGQLERHRLHTCLLPSSYAAQKRTSLDISDNSGFRTGWQPEHQPVPAVEPTCPPASPSSST
jgi:hypothetical protein